MQNTPLNFMASRCSQDMWQRKGQLSGGPFFSITTINFYFQIQPFCSIHPIDVLLNFADLCETLLTWTCNKLTIGWVMGSGRYSLCIFFLGKLLFYLLFCIKNKNTCLHVILPHGKFLFSWWNKVVPEDTEYLSTLFWTWLKLEKIISSTICFQIKSMSWSG